MTRKKKFKSQKVEGWARKKVKSLPASVTANDERESMTAHDLREKVLARYLAEHPERQAELMNQVDQEQPFLERKAKEERDSNEAASSASQKLSEGASCEVMSAESAELTNDSLSSLEGESPSDPATTMEISAAPVLVDVNQVIGGLMNLGVILLGLGVIFESVLPGAFYAENLILLGLGVYLSRIFARIANDNYPEAWRRLFANIRSHYWSRLGLLLAFVTLYAITFRRDWLEGMLVMSLTSALLVNNLYQILQPLYQQLGSLAPNPYASLWLVSLIGQSIMVLPLLFYGLYRWHRQPILMANILLVVTGLSAFLMGYQAWSGHSTVILHLSPLTRLFAVTLGASLGLLFTHPVHAKPIGRMARLMLNLVATITVVILMSLMLFMNGGQVANYQWGMQVYTLIAALLVSLSMHQSSWTYQLLSSRLWNGFRRLRLTSLLWVYPVYLISQDWLAQLAIPLLVSQFIQLGLWLLVAYGIESLLDRFELGREHLELTKSTSLKQGFQAAWTRSPRKAYGMIGLLLVLLVGWGVSLTSPNKIDELARRVEDARHQAQTTQSEDYQPRLVINNIDGLNRQELLYANGLDVTMMADAVLGDSSEEIMQIIPKSVILTYPDQALYQVTPQISTVEDRLLKGTVISMFGHQQHFTQQQLLDYLAAFDPKTDHYLLTLEESSVSHRDINQTIRELAQVDGRVKIIDWANYASDHPEWFQDQGPFLTETGQQELVKYIAKEFYRQK